MNPGASWARLLEAPPQQRLAATMVTRVLRGIHRAANQLATLESANGFLAAQRATLDRGAAGWAVLLHQAKAAGLAVDDDVLDTCLDHAATSLADHELTPTLFHGMLGLAWAHLQANAADDDDLQGIDEATLQFLRGATGPLRHDLIEGLPGIGVWALERFEAPLGRDLLAAVVHRLVETARPMPSGVCWWTAPPGPNTQGSPSGIYDLGLARGIAGIIAILGAAVARDVEASLARHTVQGAVSFLLAQRVPQEAGLFPAFISLDQGPIEARQGWCYGDAGVASALMSAGHNCARHEWIDVALELAHHAADLRPERCHILDANFCHGAAGVGHMLNRIWQATGDEATRAGALRWFEHAIALQQQSANTSFHEDAAWPADPADPGIDRTHVDLRLLYGETGMALALLAATHPAYPAWDRIFLVDPAPSIVTAP